MKVRTNIKTDPNRNRQLRDGEIQLEPEVQRFDNGQIADFANSAISIFVTPEEHFAPKHLQLSIQTRSVRGATSHILLSKNDLEFLITELQKVHNKL
jgi:hypothetical protein